MRRQQTNPLREFLELTEVTDAEKKKKKIKKAVCVLCDELQLAYTGGMTNHFNHLESM